MAQSTDLLGGFLAAVRELRIEPTTWVPQAEGWVQTYGDGAPEWDGTAMWSRDGILWADAPAPPRFHAHYVQTYGAIGLRQIFRCPCGAIGDSITRRWVMLDPPRVREGALSRAISGGDVPERSRWLDFLAASTVVGLVVAIFFAFMGWNPWGALTTAAVSGVAFRVVVWRSRRDAADEGEAGS